MTIFAMDWRGRLMVNQDVNDTLHDIKQWAKAYEILLEWDKDKCGANEDCSKCGFNEQCTEAAHLVRR